MSEKPTKKDDKDKTRAVDIDGKETHMESDVIGNSIDDEVSDIEEKIRHLIHQFDDGEPFNERRQPPIQYSTDSTDVKDAIEAVNAENDIHQEKEKPVAGGERREDIKEDAEKMAIVDDKRPFFRVIYIAGAVVFLIVIAAIVAIRSMHNTNKDNDSKKMMAYKIPPPDIKPQEKKILPPENDAEESRGIAVGFKEHAPFFHISDVQEKTAVIPSVGSSTYPYTIHIGSYQDKENVESLIAMLKTEGRIALTSVFSAPGKKDLYRVFVNFYQTLEEAQNAALKLKKEKPFYIKVVNKPYAIQLGSFDSNDELKKIKADLWSKGYTPYSVVDPHDKNRTRLLLGAYDSVTDAAEQAEKLKKEGFDIKAVYR